MIYYGLLAFFVLEYVRPGNFIPGVNALRLNSVVPLAVIAATLVTKGLVSHHDVFKDTATRAILVFVAMITLSVLTAEVTLYAYNVFTMVFGYVLIFWVVAKESTNLDRIKGIFKVLIFVHVLLAALTPQMFVDSFLRLASGTFLGDGNDFALSVNLVIPFCLFLLFDARKVLAKLLYAATLLFLVLCIVLTQSRGGTIALAVVALYYWIKSDKKIITALCGVAAIVVVLVVAPPAYFERMNSISNYEEDNSAQGRITAWKAAFGMALDNPILGVGAGQFPSNFTRYAPPEAGRWTTAHSIYFLIMAELGFTGLLTLFTFIGGNIWANGRLAAELRTRSPDRLTDLRLLSSLNASVMAYATAGAFLSAAYYPHMFVLGGLLVAARRVVRQRAEVTQPTASLAPDMTPITYHWALQRAVQSRRPRHDASA